MERGERRPNTDLEKAKQTEDEKITEGIKEEKRYRDTLGLL